MKKLFTLLAFAITIIAIAQAPQGFNYQATVRNSSGALVINQNVFFKFNIMLNSQTSLPVYSETHQAPTDDLGQVNLTVGNGTATTGTFAGINWASGSYFLGIELNTGSGYVAMGTTQLLSVPYALYANSAGSVGNASVNNLTFPTLITNSVTNITSNGATFNGNIGNYSSDKLLDKGFVCSLTPKPTYFVASMFNQALILSCGNSVGNFQYTQSSDLLSNSTYYVRAYAVTENNIVVYGNELSFVTTAATQIQQLTGPINLNLTLVSGNYTLDGIVMVESGATLTFEAGSTITADISNGVDAIVVKNGGKLIVNGTSSQPVVFTEASGIPGSWGGIIMYGDAPIKAAGGTANAVSEDGNSIVYGGTNPAHNGGSLNYVRVEYAGATIGDGIRENDGFAFYSCGSGTTLNHLVSYKCADDGFEFFGGTVSMTNAISYGNYDDAFDWRDGWQGQNNSNWYAYQVTKGNYGMEIECNSNNNSFWPIVSNITLKRAPGCTPEVIGDSQVDAFWFRKEGNGEFSNIIIDGYGEYTEGVNTYLGAAVKIGDASTNINQVNGSKIKLTNVKITNTSQTTVGATGAISVSFPAGQFTTSTTATGASLVPGAWSTVGGVNLLQ